MDSTANTAAMAVPSSARRAPRTTPQAIGYFLGRFHLPLVTALLFAVLLVTIPSFGTTGNLANLLTQASFAGIIACGMTLLIAGGAFDLSVAAIVAVSSVAVATVLPHTSVGGAVVVGLAAGAVLGAINGLVVTRLKIPAFIATLGTYNLFLALAFIWTDGNVIPISSTYFRQFTTASVLGVPVVFLVFVAVAALSHLLLHRTHFGRALRAAGSNEAATRMAGVNVERVRQLAFVITGLLSGVAAVFLAGLLSSANGTIATGIELNAIAIAVVGGTALRGGSGSLLGTFTAALLIGIVNNALNLLRVEPYWQYVAVGLVLVVALVFGNLRGRHGKVKGADG